MCWPRLACRVPPPLAAPRLAWSPHLQTRCPRRYDIAGFLLPAVIACYPLRSMPARLAAWWKRLPTRSTGPRRFIGVLGRTASRVTGAAAARRRASLCNWRDNPRIGSTTQPWRRWRLGLRSPLARSLRTRLGASLSLLLLESTPSAKGQACIDADQSTNSRRNR
jgi:hypothetical protein